MTTVRKRTPKIAQEKGGRTSSLAKAKENAHTSLKKQGFTLLRGRVLSYTERGRFDAEKRD